MILVLCYIVLVSNTLVSISILTALVVVEFVSDIVVKKWTLQQAGAWTLVPTFLIFVGAFFLWILAMKVEMFSRVINYYALLSVIGGSVLGYLFFQEKMSLINIFGIVLALISIALISK
jgi:multidrug transporter EmrE-like cation transporter